MTGLLLTTLFLPLAVAILLLVGRRTFSREAAGSFALLGSLATLVVSLALANQYVQLPADAAPRSPVQPRFSHGVSLALVWRCFAGRRRSAAFAVRFSVGRRWHQPVADRADDAAHGFVRADFVGIDSRSGGRVLRLLAVAGSGAGGRFHRVRFDSVLCVFRIHAGAAVLLDRHLGRAAAAVCGGQVLSCTRLWAAW